MEARHRVGGRVFTADLGAPIDLGASIVTGTDQSPVTLLCEQTGSSLYKIGHEGKIFDLDGEELDEDDDTHIEAEFNRLLDMTCKKRYEQNKRAIVNLLMETSDAAAASPSAALNAKLRRQSTRHLVNSLSLGKVLHQHIEHYLAIIKDGE